MKANWKWWRGNPVAAIAMLFVAFVPGADGLDSSYPINQYAMEFTGKREGLPQFAVYDIVQSADGFVWFATEEGLCRYDGLRMTLYNSGTTPSLPDDVVNALTEDTHGVIWVGTDRGLSRLADGRMTNVTSLLGVASTKVRKLATAAGGVLWVADGNGLQRLEGNQVLSFGEKEGIPSGAVTCVLPEGDRSAWAGTTHGLVHLEDGRVTVYTAREGLPFDEVSSLCYDRSGGILVGTARGLAIFKQGGMQRVELPAGNGQDEIRAILCEEPDVVWIGTSSGLLRKKGNKIERLDKKNGLPDSFVVSLKTDREGSLWVGTMFGGAIHLHNPSVTTMGTEEGLAGDNMACIVEGKDRSLWVGEVSSGLDRLVEGRVEHYSKENGLPDNFIRSLYESPDGVLWVGTRSGVVHRDGNRFVAPPPGGPTDAVPAIAGDQSGALWFGTTVGLWRLNASGWKRFLPSDGVPQKAIYALHVARDGSLWIGTEDSGLLQYSGGNFQVFRTADGLAGDQVLDIYEDSKGDLWVSTDRGISRYRNGSFKTVGRKQGLLSDSNFRLLEDDQGYLWMSSNLGVARVKKSNLNEVAEGVAAQCDIETFGTDDGMRESECNGSVQPAGARTMDGRLWFPTSKGFAIIDPHRLWRNLVPPKVIIDGVWLDNRPRASEAALELPPSGGELRFRYTAPTFIRADHARFKYRLDRLDSEWHDGENRREATYVNLAPGDYTFRVVGANSQGVWAKDEATVRFTKRPYFWQTMWFFGACVLGLSGLAWGAHLWRLRSYARRQAELARRVQEALAEIKTLSGMLPICAWCKKIRNDKGYWEQIETYVSSRSSVRFSHGMCKECLDKWERENGTLSDESSGAKP